MKRNRTAKNTEFRKLLKQAFALNQRPLPWAKALAAGISSGLPVLIGVLLGQFHYGLIASLGGLAFLYMFNEPYALRSKKIFLPHSAYRCRRVLAFYCPSSHFLPLRQ